MHAKRLLLLCVLLHSLLGFETTQSLEPKNTWFYVGSGNTMFGPPTPAFFMEHPDKATASLVAFIVACGVAAYASKKVYDYHAAKNAKKIKKELQEKYQKMFNAQLTIEVEKHQAKMQEILKMQQEKMREIMEATKSNVKVYEPGEIKETFDNVAGMHAVKEDFQDIINYLDDPEAFHALGATPPRGILLSGPPGVGKTLIARALAGEADCTFLYIHASQFNEMYVGRGAARVRDLFETARKHAPCILFIDELDAVAAKRNDRDSASGDHSQTLNQLLAEMDGFEVQEQPVIVIGATNRVESLDPAILRPGRLDKTVTINLPRIVDRREIIAVHLRKVIHRDINIDLIARGTVGFSGAQIAHLINEAALIALRRGDHAVTMAHLDESRDVILLGGKETSDTFELTREDLWETAVHEAGHALMHVFEANSVPLYKVTIRPRGGALGITFGMYDRDSTGKTQENMLAHIRVCLGGSVAEELSFKRRGTGISSDLKQARAVAKQMVMIFGMSNEFKDVSFQEYIGIGREFALPPHVSDALHKEITHIIHESREHVTRVLSKHIDKLHEVARQLMKKGTLYGSEVYKICGVPEPSLEYSFVQVP